MAGIGAKSVTVRNGLGLSINDELVRVLPVRFAVERRPPSPKEFLQSFLWNPSELADRLDPHRAQCGFCDASDSGNAAYGKWLKEFGLRTRGNPYQAAGLGLI